MLKTIITIFTLLIFFALLILFGCRNDSATKQNKPVVVCTTTMIADLAKNLSAGRFEVIGLMKTGEDPHIYKPRPMDAMTIQKARVLLRNGLHLEGTLTKIIENNLSASAFNIALGEHPLIKPIESAKYKGAPDPHCWFNVSYFRIYAEACRDAFIRADPEGKTEFEKAASAYIAELDKLQTYVQEQLAKIPKERRVLITSHDAFQYFGQAYDIDVYAIIGISTEQQPRPQDVENLLRLVSSRRIKAVFIETSVSDTLNNLVKKVSEKTGIHVGGVLYSDSLGDETTPAHSYTGMVRYNVDTIVKALQ